MKPVFSCSFDVSLPNHSAKAAFQRATELTRSWILTKYEKPVDRYGFGHPINISDAPSELKPKGGHLIRWDEQSCPVGELRTFSWEHPGDEPDEYWSIQVILAHDNSQASVTLHTQIGSRRYTLKPVLYEPGIPGLVRTLLREMQCSLNGWPILSSHYTVLQGQVEQFAKNILLAPQRTLPILVVSRDMWSDKPCVEPEQWARSLAGLTEVAVLENKWAGFQLTDIVGKPLSCYNGAIRIYWPGLTLHSEANHHRLWLPADIISAQGSKASLDKRLLGFLCAVAATNHVDSVIVHSLRREIAAHRDADRAAQIVAAREGAKEPKELEALLNVVLQENTELRGEKTTLAEELHAMRLAVEEARREIENHRDNYLAIRAEKPAKLEQATLEPILESMPAADSFGSVLEAYDRAKMEFGGPESALVFLDSARKSAIESPYLSPERVYFLIKELHTLATKWRDGKGKLGCDWRTALLPTGFEFKPRISPTTKAKYGEEYHFVYDGESRFFEEHVTKGAKDKNACFSLHMFRDESKLRLVIGHCGNHLSNTST
jgi:hypothetical protein